MKKLLLAAAILALATMIHVPARAAVDINIGIALPPPIVLPAPPDLIVLPSSDDVWVDPDVGVELFFWDGWWWYFWEGRWYRSHYYDREWVYYDATPVFFFGVDPEWRVFCREHRWHGHRWDFQRLPAREVRDHWRGWHKNRYWERHKGWNVANYRPQSRQQRSELRRQRQTQYQQRSDVQRHAQERQQFRQRQRPATQRPAGREQQRGAQQRPQRVQPQPGTQHERRAPQVREHQPGAQIPHGQPSGPRQHMEAPRPGGRPSGQPGGHGGQPGGGRPGGGGGHPGGGGGHPGGQPHEEHGR